MTFIDWFAGIGGFRLQGWSDDYFEKAAFVNSNSQLYKQAGNGVTVNVIKAIAERMEIQ